MFFGEPALELADLMRTDHRRPRRHQHPRRRAADPEAAAVFELPAVAAVGAVREPAGSRRPRQAQAGVRVRRGAPAVRRRAAGAAAARRAGGAPDPLQGRGRVFLLAVPRRRARRHPRPARQPRAARAARVHAARPEGGEDRRRDLRRRIRRSTSPRRSRKLGVGEALVSTLQDKGMPMPVETHADRAAALPHGRDHRSRTRAGACRAARSAASTTRASTATRPRRCWRRRPRPPPSRPRRPPARDPRAGRGRGRRLRPVGQGRRVRHQAPPGHGRDHGQADRAHRRQPDRPADPARRAGRHLRRPPIAGAHHNPTPEVHR